MKKTFAFLAVLSVLFACSLPSFAAEAGTSTAKPFVPEVPSFVNLTGNTRVAFETTNAEIQKTFIDNLTDSPYMVLLRQENTYDQKFYIYIYKFPKSLSAEALLAEFNYGDPRTAHPMHFQPMPNGTKYIFLQYDAANNKLLCNNKIYENLTMLSFSYVIDASPLSGSLGQYPHRDTLTSSGGSGRFYVYPEDHEWQINGQTINRYYDWWLPVRTGTMPPTDQKPDPEEPDPDNPDPDKPDPDPEEPDPDINIDTDGDGKPDLNVDTDGDGKPDINIDTDGDRKPDLNIDTDGDGKPDLNVDTNGDGKPDINIDTNGDGKPDINIDTNGDGKPDINIDTNGDKKPDVNIDTNGDKKPDLNIDADGDGKPDLDIDADGDGKPDTNVDTDGDGWPDHNLKPGGSGGGPSGGGGGSSGSWEIPPKDDNGIYDDWHVFDPFDYDFTPADSDYSYDPMAGIDISDVRIPDYFPMQPEIGSVWIPKIAEGWN